MTVTRPTREGQKGVDGIRKYIDISRKFFLRVVEKRESCTKGVGGKLEVGEAKCRAMQGGGLQTGNGSGNGEHLLDTAA